MKFSLKEFLILFVSVMIISLCYIYYTYNIKTQLNNNAEIIDEKIQNKTIEFIKNENLSLQDKNNIEYILTTNHKVQFEIKDYDLISFIEFDGNIMNYETKDSIIKTFSTSYEIVPSNYKIKIYYNSGIIENYDVNVKYLFKSDISKKENIEKFWYFSPQSKYSINNDGITLLGQYENNQPTMMQYYKDFNGDISMRLDFEVLKDNVTDLKFSFGERISIFVNNSRIDLYRREFNKKIEKDVWVKYNFIKDFSRLKKGVKYSIYLKRFNVNTYSLEFIDHSNELKNKSGTYIDNKKNQIAFERYKNLRIIVGSEQMKILIKKVELN